MSKDSEVYELIDGHDRDVALAILNQARLRSSPIDETQVLHLIQIGHRAGKGARTDVTVISPECFASSDGAVISWRGENYYHR